jgi:hypothetical protein
MLSLREKRHLTAEVLLKLAFIFPASDGASPYQTDRMTGAQHLLFTASLAGAEQLHLYGRVVSMEANSFLG